MNLGEFIDTYKDAIARRVVESYPPLYRPSETGRMLPDLLRTPLGAQEDAIRARPSPCSPERDHRGGGDGDRQDLHRHRRGPHGGLPESPGVVPAPSDQEVEEGGGGDGTPGPRRHRHLHHRPGDAQVFRGFRPPLRRHVQGEGQAVLPVEAGRWNTGGPCPKAGW